MLAGLDEVSRWKMGKCCRRVPVLWRPKSPRMRVKEPELPSTLLRVESVMRYSSEKHSRSPRAQAPQKVFKQLPSLPDLDWAALARACVQRSSELAGPPEHLFRAQSRWARHTLASWQSSGACAVEDGQMLQGARACALAPKRPRMCVKERELPLKERFLLN